MYNDAVLRESEKAEVWYASFVRSEESVSYVSRLSSSVNSWPERGSKLHPFAFPKYSVGGIRALLASCAAPCDHAIYSALPRANILWTRWLICYHFSFPRVPRSGN